MGIRKKLDLRLGVDPLRRRDHAFETCLDSSFDNVHDRMRFVKAVLKLFLANVVFDHYHERHIRISLRPRLQVVLATDSLEDDHALFLENMLRASGKPMTKPIAGAWKRRNNVKELQ